MQYTIELNMPLLDALRELSDLQRNSDLADAMGITPASLSRTLNGLSRPGPVFLGGLKKAFPTVSYDKILVARPVDEPTQKSA